MIPKILLAMESITEELTIGMKSECETLTLTIHLRVAALKIQLISLLIQGTHGETSIIEGIDERTPLITKESKQDEAWDEIIGKFPKVDTNKFTPTLDDIGRVFVKLIRANSKYSPLFNKDGELNDKLPKTIKDALGPPAEDIAETNREEISRHEKKIQELQVSRETSENRRENIDADIEE